MLDTLITSRTRIKLLLKFFINSSASAYLRSLATEFGESTNAIRIELNRFEDAGLLEAYTAGNKKMFRANTKHPMFPDIQKLIHKFVGIDKILDKVISRLGEVNKVFVTGDFANGIDGPVIGLLIVADELDRAYLSRLVEKTEPLVNRKISYIVLTAKEFVEYKESNGHHPTLLIYGNKK